MTSEGPYMHLLNFTFNVLLSDKQMTALHNSGKASENTL